MALYISPDLKLHREFTNSITKLFHQGTKLEHNSHEIPTKRNILVHAGMIDVQKCFGRIADESHSHTLITSRIFLYLCRREI